MTTTTIDGVDYGPLAAFVGNWFGDEGLDHSPEPDGSEDSPYYDPDREDEDDGHDGAPRKRSTFRALLRDFEGRRTLRCLLGCSDRCLRHNSVLPDRR